MPPFLPLFLSVFCGLVLVGFPGTSHAGAQDFRLKLLTYNIHHGNPPGKPGVIDLKAIAAVITESGADVAAIQEVDVKTRRSGSDLDQAAELGRLVNMHHFFAKAIDHAGGEYGVAILSRFPILKSDALSLPMVEGSKGEPRVLASVQIEPQPGMPLVIACTHLDLRLENRLLQAQAITDHFGKQPHATILCGDLNDAPGSAVIRLLDQSFLRSQSRSDVPAAAYTEPHDKPAHEIDFIMHRPQQAFKSVTHRVIPASGPSDHLPVYVELVLR